MFVMGVYFEKYEKMVRYVEICQLPISSYIKNYFIYLYEAIKGNWLTDSLTDVSYEALSDVWPSSTL